MGSSTSPQLPTNSRRNNLLPSLWALFLALPAGFTIFSLEGTVSIRCARNFIKRQHWLNSSSPWQFSPGNAGRIDSRLLFHCITPLCFLHTPLSYKDALNLNYSSYSNKMTVLMSANNKEVFWWFSVAADSQFSLQYWIQCKLWERTKVLWTWALNWKRRFPSGKC